jgi:hypothetical protein
LEHDLPLPSEADKFRATRAGDRLTLEAHFARTRVLQADERSSERALSAAALPYEAESAAAVDREINAVDGPQKPLPRNLEMPDQTDGLHKDFTHEALQQAT